MPLRVLGALGTIVVGAASASSSSKPPLPRRLPWPKHPPYPLTLTVDAGVAELTPPYRRSSTACPRPWEELPAALEALEARGDVRVLIIASTGKHFTAGMDVSASMAAARRLRTGAMQESKAGVTC